VSGASQNSKLSQRWFSNFLTQRTSQFFRPCIFKFTPQKMHISYHLTQQNVFEIFVNLYIEKITILVSNKNSDVIIFLTTKTT
jgi:hypothetical protein